MRDRLSVFGIDIVKGSVRSRSRRPMYALVRIVDGTIVSESTVSMFRLFRLLSEERPDILAVDSIQEIATDQHELFFFLQGLPPQTKLVQVTGGEKKETLGKVAARFNISFDRFDPFAEARTSARVASLGAGAEVIAFENESEVVVSRHRSPGRGGWSQNRYVRKIHGAVQLKGREIEQQLAAAGLRYEKKETKAFGGCSRVAFTVFAPRREVPVSTYRGADVQVRISGKRLERIRYRPLSGKPRYLIVGIDPGTTTAVAALDLDGNLMLLSSSRQMNMSGVIESLYKTGKPLVVASDVQEMPYSVEKIRRAFSAIPYSPKQDTSVDAKLALTADFPYENVHERDALSAALDAFHQYDAKFRNLLRRVPPGHDLDEVRARVIRGQALDQVLGDLAAVPAPAPAPESAPAPVVARQDERVRVLDGIVKRLRGYTAELEETIKAKEYEIHRLQGRLRAVHDKRDLELAKETEITKRDAIIQSLKKRLRKEERHSRTLAKRVDRIKSFAELSLDGDALPVKVMDALTREGLRRLAEDTGIREGDIVFVQKSDGWGKGIVKDIADAKVGALVLPAAVPGGRDLHIVPAFREAGIPVIAADDAGVQVKGKKGLAAKDQFEGALLRWKEEQVQFVREKESNKIEHMFKEYKSERGKEVKKGGGRDNG
jgi:predicted RNase H-like nuclease (RuvC/YqgF family)